MFFIFFCLLPSWIISYLLVSILFWIILKIYYLLFDFSLLFYVSIKIRSYFFDVNLSKILSGFKSSCLRFEGNQSISIYLFLFVEDVYFVLWLLFLWLCLFFQYRLLRLFLKVRNLLLVILKGFRWGKIIILLLLHLKLLWFYLNYNNLI